ncbi:helix-turn-helix domain-containing protein [Yeguia hominis]|uniref:Helix-turn-helix transcriptional regulator n=1 Tax=Yeguia hominis TaxID=2763662 RepID=A0A926DBU9_9FIRM|nr:AraC family transcriptional regulator [Yeguia hominis]MBC8534954.1 helix-turn-helix transcriptional regulator [Yeguia hominis]
MYHLMDCVEKREVQACNFSLLEGGVLHPDRTMENTHDLLYILEGGWEVVEDGEVYSLSADDLLFLHAGHHHYGKVGCLPNTLSMFIHCSKSPADSVISQNQVRLWEDAVLIDSVTHCQKNTRVKKLLKDMIYHYYSNMPHIQIKLSALLIELFYELATTSSQWSEGQVEDDLVNEIIYKIRTAPQMNYTMQELAKETYVSTSTLIKHFKKVTGTTVYQYQLNTKLEMARLLLINEQHVSLKEIAASYGFCDEFHFSKLFKKKYGLPPTQYRKEAQPAVDGVYLVPSPYVCGQ